MTERPRVRIATPDDADAVSRVLRASYGALMKPAYSDTVLEAVLPLITTANPALLAGGTFYVALLDGTIVGCGGWTFARPGAPDAPVDPKRGHIRHFATDPAWTRRGVARALMDRCITDAEAVGATTLEAYATLVAEEFYRSAGFRTVAAIDVPIRPGVDLTSLRMIRSAAPDPAD